MSSEESGDVPKVLVVDDEASIVEIVAAFLKQRGFEVKGITKSSEALLTLRQWSPDILVLDLMMKELNGLQVLEAIRKDPKLDKLPVLILTAVNDRRGIMAAAKLRASAYLIKPFDSKTLVQKIEDILVAQGIPLPAAEKPHVLAEGEEPLIDHYDTTVLLDLSKVDELPAMPFIVNEVREAMQDETLDAKHLARIIEKDHSIVGHLLRIANSVHYAQSREVIDIDQAIVVVGYREVFNIVITLAVMKEFEFSDKCSSMSSIDFWAHSFSVATLSRHLAVPLGCQSPSDVFIGGIVHDLGKCLINLLCANSYQEVIAEAHEKKCWIREIEQEKLGATHTQVGGQAARSWDFPSVVRDSMRLHHIWTYGSVDSPDQVRTLRAIYISDHIARAAGLGNDGDILVESIPVELWEGLSCDNPRIVSIAANEGIKEWTKFLQPLGISNAQQTFDVEKFINLQEEDNRLPLHIVDIKGRPLNIPYFVLMNSSYKPVYHRNLKSLELELRLSKDIAGILLQGIDPSLAKTFYHELRSLPLPEMATLPICYVREVKGGSNDEGVLSEKVSSDNHLRVIQEPFSREDFLLEIDHYVTEFRHKISIK